MERIVFNTHSANTKSLEATKSGKLSFVREATSDADATAAEARPKANAENVRMLKCFEEDSLCGL